MIPNTTIQHDNQSTMQPCNHAILKQFIRKTFFGPRKHIMEAPFLRFWDFTVFEATGVQHPRLAVAPVA